MRIQLRHLVYGLAALLVIGGGIFWFGLINIGASTGHWQVTDWLLHTAMRRSVQARVGEETPEGYPTPAMIRRGAGHFESGCAPCHGSPLAERSAVVLAMTPEPPALAPRIANWESGALFWIVKHGVKFTGMPAWPVQDRDDEVWSVVAFLEALPGLSAEDYRRLAFGPAEAARDLSILSAPPLADCARCHGVGGLGDSDGAFPRLDIQGEIYLREALEAYAARQRSSGIMQAAVAGLGEAELAALARHYAGGDGEPPDLRQTAETALLERGRQIARQGIAADNVGACSGCHGRTRPEFPRLAGQHRNYLEQQLRLFAGDEDEKERGGGRFSELMSMATHALTEADIRAVSAWYATRPPAAPED